MKKAVYSLIGGVAGAGWGFLISQVTLIPLFIFLFLGGESIDSLPPIKWIIDPPYSFLIWYGILTITGLILGAIRGYRFGAGR